MKFSATGPKTANSATLIRRPTQARLDLIANGRSTATLLWNGGDNVLAYQHSFSFMKIHGSARSNSFTSLRGNGVLTPNLGDIVSCFERHKAAIEERPGPRVDGEGTNEIVLERANVQCPNDSPADAALTLDVLTVSPSGVVVMRKRYEGEQLVESWSLKDYRINAGLDDRVFK